MTKFIDSLYPVTVGFMCGRIIGVVPDNQATIVYGITVLILIVTAIGTYLRLK